MLTLWRSLSSMMSMAGHVGVHAEAEPDDPPSELSENLPGLDFYALCSTSGPKPLIRYASPGFKALFEVSAFQELSGCECLLADEPALAALSSGTRLPRSVVRAGLRWLEERVAAVGRKVAAGPRFVQRDLAWVVRVTRAGRPIVCEVTFLLHRSEDRDILVAVHRDVSRQVPVRKLLLAAATGGGSSFTASLKELAMESLYLRGPLLSSIPDAAESENAVPDKTRPRALQDVLLECSHGPVSFQLTQGGIVKLNAPSDMASVPPSKNNDEHGAGSAVCVAVETIVPSVCGCGVVCAAMAIASVLMPSLTPPAWRVPGDMKWALPGAIAALLRVTESCGGAGRSGSELMALT